MGECANIANYVLRTSVSIAFTCSCWSRVSLCGMIEMHYNRFIWPWVSVRVCVLGAGGAGGGGGGGGEVVGWGIGRTCMYLRGRKLKYCIQNHQWQLWHQRWLAQGDSWMGVLNPSSLEFKKYFFSQPFNPFTPESDQYRISPPAPPEIWHHTVRRAWLFIAYSDERWF